jgi:hypothetical protein
MMEKPMTLPPVFAASALYDNLLQAALRQFFDRATFESEATPSLSSDGRLAIEPTNDPWALVVRWFGTRHVLTVPPMRPFTAPEVRMARAIGAVLAARYRAIFDPKQMVERGDLFRGSIEDRYVAAFLDEGAYGRPAVAAESRADLVAGVIEVLRVAALSSYENRPISSGVLLLDGLADPVRGSIPDGQAYPYSLTLTAVKSFYRVCDGLQTLFLVNRDGLVLDIVDLGRWQNALDPNADMEVTCPVSYRAHARSTSGTRNICVVLSPNHEIKIFAEGVQMFTFNNARWHLLDLKAKFDLWNKALGNTPLAERLFQTALDLADARQGALFVVLRNAHSSLPHLVAPQDQLDSPLFTPPPAGTPPGRTQLMYMLRGRTATSIDPAVLGGLARVDGATVMDPSGRLLAIGAILLHAEPVQPHSAFAVEGARTTAAMAAARHGAVLKVSEDGGITFFDRQERVWDI